MTTGQLKKRADIFTAGKCIRHLAFRQRAHIFLVRLLFYGCKPCPYTNFMY